MFNKVFIAHAKEDIEQAKSLFEYLNKSTPFKPWLDKENLLPGHNWREEINQALRLADFIIILFSKIAITKTGYIQKEFKLALDYFEQRPEDSIYIIPVLTDNCTIPEKFAKYQWVDLNDWDAYNQIHASLRQQRDIYLKTEMLKIAQNLSYEYTSHNLEETLGDTIFHKISISYPQFTKTTIKSLLHLNTYILADVYRMYNGFLHISPLNEPNGNPNHPGNESRTNYNFELITPGMISLTVYNYSYIGGLHGNYGTVGMNFRLNPLLEVYLKEILDYQDEILLLFAQLCKSKLLERASEVFDVNDENEFFLKNFDEQINWEFLGNFYVGDKTLTVIFVPYQVTAYSYGQHEITVTFEEVRKVCGSLIGLDWLESLILPVKA
ncbi:Protein of unknown function [Mucilaginibacter lappiensis]|uniref:TIR domain-containing protein n=1 Tax=Mucilaginibacter lappiensis TaxID=354630 RepID=A0ABR6PDQ7_9SPHI|nr:TIR domain-containing protein [Mucilaginibacter lappiensis]MBB6107905.1 hypothetical protein [Mucilaginibacter lappiensis]SIP93052.1 Protein of unknown function [Mucilaginibacter lappiensis]